MSDSKANAYLDEIQERCRRVDRLLSDRQIGLASWGIMLGKEMSALTTLWVHGVDGEQKEKT